MRPQSGLERRRIAMVMTGIAVVAFAGLTVSSRDTAVAAQSPEQVIEFIEFEVEDAEAWTAEIVESAIDDLAGAATAAEAANIYTRALQRIEQVIGNATSYVTQRASFYPDDPLVQDAYGTAVAELQSIQELSVAALTGAYGAWVEENGGGTTTTATPPQTTTTSTSTTTTAVPTTTTSTSTQTTTSTGPWPTSTTTTSTSTTSATTTSTPTTSTSTTSTSTTSTSTTTTTTTTTSTSTTLAAAAQLPPVEPPTFSGTEYLADPPATIRPTANEAGSPDSGTMAALGLVERVVDSQLPAGVATVAAGPLVVIGLIIDAIRAAGGLMVVPWVVLVVYVAALLRRNPLDSATG